MGVHNLWSIVEPIRESVPLFSLSGKTLAVDLSLWVCEAQHVQGMMGKVTKPHLRNLFFRVSSLTLMGVKLVFVMEGEAPKIKSETMSKRTEARYGTSKKVSASRSGKTASRGRFNAVLRECAEMLDYLGVPWVAAAGEAEAMCAYLDSQGLVDGCITNDGDAFLYGAQTVYRNFNLSSKDPQVDCYQTSRLQKELNLTRENLVGLAILLGCDYIPKGIPGVGREQALKLMQTLRGQSLLQRFVQWKEKDINLSKEGVKKVSHCNICQHPGSAKTHEHKGCSFCHSQQFCQPQDFDYRCPCDWHRYENSRQLLSLEANIRKKTLASQQFPFTEIIREFLVSKDSHASHFKRRQPNMLLMQKFAFDKLEWPKHYTSEKVLVLMTYSELLNKKHGKVAPSQIHPIRIFKPRVRNATACFEVIWSTPEHYAFPEDGAAEDQHEVRTVEEESLFRLAFPEIVESYVRSKALAEENKNKLKKNKTKSKKEKPPNVSDGVSDLLARMTLHSSSSDESSSQTKTTDSNPNDPEVIVLDTPVSCKRLGREKENRENPRYLPSLAESEVAASPSVSAVVDALHLSDIDWEAMSFTSSPASQASQMTEEEQKKSASDDVRHVDFAECSLRDRLLMTNRVETKARMEKSDGVCPVFSNESASIEFDSFGKNAHKNSRKATGDGNPAVKKSETLLMERPLGTQIKKEKTQQIPKLQAQVTTERYDDPKKPPHTYKFVRRALSSLARSSHSDPGPSDGKNTKIPPTSKKSVCTSACSSSDEENRRPGQLKLRKTKPDEMKKSFVSEVHQKQTFIATVTKPSWDDADEKRRLEQTKSKFQDVETVEINDDDDVFTPTAASPVTVPDNEDSVICSDSPLPLAERLRLKFGK